ncbi:MAG: SEC-C domain-containing protein [Gemmataceae bacterium]|nr:SEC-C domain-containing protein [Gemmataceae bacterium]
MNKDRQLDASLWDKISDGFTAVSEGFVGFLGRLFGSANERMVRSLGFIRHRDGAYHITPGSTLDEVNQLESQMQALSDADLKGLTPKFKERLAKGETLEDILPEAFAACREAGRRFKNMRHFDVQILGGIVLHRGNIAEMVTGEGKTLVATLPAYLNALTGKGVHVITVNDYLARRDCEWMSPIYYGLGITAGFIQSDMDPGPRRESYERDITYGTNSEFGFDYLRDNMKRARHADPNYEAWEQQVQRGLNFAIIDEVDNILIDEARTPLIISGPAQDDPDLYRKADRIARQLTELERKAQGKLKEAGHGLHIPDHPLTQEEAEAEQSLQESKKRKISAAEAKEAIASDAAVAEAEIDVTKALSRVKENEKRLGYYFEVKEKEHTCHLTDEGVRKAEELAGVDSFYTAGNMEWPHLIDNALKAHHLYHKDKRYVVMRHPETKETAVILVDEFTGRLMVGRQLSDGLHQALEAKHERDGVKIKEETQTLATVTLQNFFKLYKKLAGMTGTAMTEANEFWKIYKLDVVAIPTNKPLTRVNYADLIYLTEKEKWDAVVGEVERIHKFDTLVMRDGTMNIGRLVKRGDTEVEFELKDSRERKTFPIAQIDEIETKGRPILIGTTDVDKSEKLSKMLQRRGIKHELLNAKPEYASREAEIVAQAGRIGSVTISTNMAGRGTDIILGGNPEFMAWARLKDQYATLLDVPPEVWKQTVKDIREKENLEEEGKLVSSMGGLHIVGTERHESRRIDNQLRGRAGRQGDPGSGRFFLSLQDDLMRIFAGEWVAGVLQRLGMEQGQAIESRMVSRRIEGAQKKVEERNFDIRKNLLEYDEVMDYQRKKVYGFRQEVLDGDNSKIRILDMIDKQIASAVERFLDPNYGAASFAEMASQRLNMEFEPATFARANFRDADVVAREKAAAAIQTRIHELMDEHIPQDGEPSEWNWSGLSDRVNKVWDLKTRPEDLRRIGRDDVAGFLIGEAEKSLDSIDLSKGEIYLSENWGLQSLSDWMKQKFDIVIDPKDLIEQPKDKVQARLHAEVAKIYRNKEVEFPVTVAMARFMAERQGPGPMMGQRYDREGLMTWFRARFPQAATSITEDDFRTQSRARLQERLLEASRNSYPQADQETIDDHLDQVFQGAEIAEAGDAQEMSDWARATFQLEVPAEALTGVSKEQARHRLWNAFDTKYRSEMRRAERGLLLDRLDRAWKNHLYVMDHLRQGIGLVGYAQIDPKTEYKRQGMKEFDAMWDGLGDKVTEAVFRLEDDESFSESIWSISQMVHEAAPKHAPAEGSMQAEQEQAIAGSQQSEKKVEPIRNRTEKVGRNDPCTCGSGKKYKNCCMRTPAK